MRESDQSSGDTPSNRGFLWGVGGGLLAAFCCAGPLVAVLIGIGGATSLIGLVRFKWEFLVAGLLLTLVGIGVSLQRSKASCSIADYRRNRILLPVVCVSLFSLLAIGSQYALLNDRIISAASSRLSAQMHPRKDTASVAAPQAHQMDVAISSGVNCAACLLAIEKKLSETPGVTSAGFVKVPEAKYTVRVVYDPAQVSQAILLDTIAQSPGAAGGNYGTKVLSDTQTT